MNGRSRSKVNLVVIAFALLTAAGIWGYVRGKWGAHTPAPLTLPACIVGNKCEVDCVPPKVSAMVGNKQVLFCCTEGYEGGVVKKPGTEEVIDVICNRKKA